MQLPAGVSGFYDSDEHKPPEFDVAKYKELCHRLARDMGAQLQEFTDSLYPANFHKALFHFQEKDICLVMNKHYPLLAFANTADSVKVDFINFPAGNSSISEDFKVLPKEKLETPVPKNPDELRNSGLNKGEIEQIKYWKPERLGEVVFNFWD